MRRVVVAALCVIVSVSSAGCASFGYVKGYGAVAARPLPSSWSSSLHGFGTPKNPFDPDSALSPVTRGLACFEFVLMGPIAIVAAFDRGHLPTWPFLVFAPFALVGAVGTLPLLPFTAAWGALAGWAEAGEAEEWP